MLSAGAEDRARAAMVFRSLGGNWGPGRKNDPQFGGTMILTKTMENVLLMY